MGTEGAGRGVRSSVVEGQVEAGHRREVALDPCLDPVEEKDKLSINSIR